MRSLLLLVVFLPVFVYSQAPITEVDTTRSRTRLYAALNSKNVLYKREEYELNTDELQCTGVVLKRLNDGAVIKGCRLYGNSLIWQNNSSMGYMDDNEIDDIVSTLKYISDSIDLQKRPQQNVWVYYKTVDDFEIGVRAAKGKRFEVYFLKNYRVLADRSVSLGRLSLTEAYRSFLYVRDFLKKQ